MSLDSLPRLNFFARLLDNPVILKELKGRMRAKNGFLPLTVFLTLLAFFVSSIYLIFWADDSLSSPDYFQIVGKSLFGAVILTELLMIGFIAPALTVGAISGERERGAFDLLRVSLLSAWELTLGKLTAAVAYLFLLVAASFPAISFAFLLGGVDLAEAIVSMVMLAAASVFYAALGLFCSSFSKRVLTSTVLVYGARIFSFAFFLFALFALAVVSSAISSAPSFFNELLSSALWFIFSLNPFFAAVVSEILLVEEGSLFIASGNFWSVSFPLPSPWLICVAAYVLLTVVLISLSAYFVGRVES